MTTKEQALETLEVGDLVKTRFGEYCRVLFASGEEELRVYILSVSSTDITSSDLKKAYHLPHTALQLKEYSYTVVKSGTVTVEQRKSQRGT